MPQDDLYLPSSIISKLFAQVPQSLPKSSLTIDDAQRNKTAKADREKLPAWKQFLQGGLESIAGASTLSDPNEDLKNPYGYGKTSGELVQLAGIAFPPGKKVFHGTPRLNKITEQGYKAKPYMDEPGYLGWMTHFSEHPEYAEKYTAMPAKISQYVKRGSGNELPYNFRREGIIPAELKSENALNIFDTPSKEDIDNLLKGLSKTNREIILEGLDYAGNDPQKIRNVLGEAVDYLTPAQFKKTGFDAIRYQAGGKPAWAIPKPEQAIGYYDRLPLNKPSPSIRKLNK